MQAKLYLVTLLLAPLAALHADDTGKSNNPVIPAKPLAQKANRFSLMTSKAVSGCGRAFIRFSWLILAQDPAQMDRH